MKGNRFLMVLAVSIWGLVSVGSVRADPVVTVSMSNLTFVGTSSTEKVSISFLWDATTSSIQSGTMSVLASGAFGEPFNFGSFGPVSGGEGFLWVDPSGDEVSVNTCGFDCGKFPAVGTYSIGDITMLCGPSDTCSSGGFSGQAPSTGTFTVTAVPEPSSLLLLVTGLFILGPLLARRLPDPLSSSVNPSVLR